MSEHSPLRRPVRTVIDTDIGTEIDDTFAIALALRCPELKVELITTATGDTRKRAQILCKLLHTAERQDVNVGIGTHGAWKNGMGFGLWPWAADYDLSKYQGRVFEDGVTVLRDTLLSASDAEPILLLALAPFTNIAAALRLDPRLAESPNIHLASMAGSVRVGYNGWAPPDTENNILRDISAAQRIFRVQWPVSLAPLDVCMQVELRGERFAKLRSSNDPLCRAVVESYDVWVRSNGDPKWAYPGLDPNRETTTLYDTVAVLCAARPGSPWLDWETLRLTVSDHGETKECRKPQGTMVQTALGWRSLDAFLDWLADHLSQQQVDPSVKRRR